MDIEDIGDPYHSIVVRASLTVHAIETEELSDVR